MIDPKIQQMADDFESGVSAPVAEGFFYAMLCKDYQSAAKLIQEELTTASDEAALSLVEHYKPKYRSKKVTILPLDLDKIPVEEPSSKRQLPNIFRVGTEIFIGRAKKCGNMVLVDGRGIKEPFELKDIEQAFSIVEMP